jgi:hypothetical protein
VAKEAAREWVAAHEQDLEQEHGEAKGVVISRAQNPTQIVTLELRRDMGFNPHAAIECAPSVSNLETIAVDQGNGRPIRNQAVAVIDVAHDKAVLVDDGQGAGKVGRRQQKERPCCLGEATQPALGAIENVGLLPSQARHKKALGHPASSGVDRIQRPGSDLD